MIVVVMGVAGSGKTTVGRALARELGCRFLDGDDYHEARSREKMAAGVPLDDDDRWPWLDAMADELQRCAAAGEDVVLTCSALRRAYRDRLRARCPRLRLVLLDAPPAVLAHRLANRQGHFMPSSLLASQLATLERPDPEEGALVADSRAGPDALVRRLAARLRDPARSASASDAVSGREKNSSPP